MQGDLASLNEKFENMIRKSRNNCNIEKIKISFNEKQFS